MLTSEDTLRAPHNKKFKNGWWEPNSGPYGSLRIDNGRDSGLTFQRLVEKSFEGGKLFSYFAGKDIQDYIAIVLL